MPPSAPAAVHSKAPATTAPVTSASTLLTLAVAVGMFSRLQGPTDADATDAADATTPAAAASIESALTTSA